MPPLQDTYWISCPIHCEEYLAQELQALQVENFEVRTGGVRAQLSPREALTVLAQVRVAGRLFRLVKRFACSSEDELYRQVYHCPWPDILDLKQSFKVDAFVEAQIKRHFAPAFQLSLKLKDALCDRFRDQAGARPNVDKHRADYPLHLRLETCASSGQSEAHLYLELSGCSLSRRGYRQSGGEAPLRENLAAALILASDWNPSQDLLCDPFCGSGTLLVEAVLIKAQIPPSYLQIQRFEGGECPYAFLRQKWFAENPGLQRYWRNLVGEVGQRFQRGVEGLLGNQFFGSDHSEGALQLARRTLKAAGIPPEVVHFKRADARHCRPPGSAPGVVLSNLPYGERLAGERLDELYFAWGEALKHHWQGWRAYLLTSEPRLRKRVGLRTSARIPFYNGKLECRLLKYQLY